MSPAESDTYSKCASTPIDRVLSELGRGFVAAERIGVARLKVGSYFLAEPYNEKNAYHLNTMAGRGMDFTTDVCVTYEGGGKQPEDVIITRVGTTNGSVARS